MPNIFEFFRQFVPENLIPWAIGLAILLLILLLSGFFFRLLAIQIVFKELWKLFREVFNVLFPKKWDSAKTLIVISIVSTFISLFVGPTAQNIIAFVAWIYLIAGIHWVMYEEKFLKDVLTISSVHIGPWITAALICYFLFATPTNIPAIAYVVWPLIAAVLAGLPKFIGSDSANKTPKWVIPQKAADRHYLVNMGLMNLILTCWIQLYFSTQTWLAQYPSLITDDFSNSSFVLNTQPANSTTARGTTILNETSQNLEQTLAGQSWSTVEQWLLNFQQQMIGLEETIISRLPPLPENSYWTIRGKILPGEYNVQLFAIWQGPASDPAGYYFTTTCRISQVAPVDVSGQTTAPLSTVPIVGNAQVQCSPIEGPISGQPDLSSPS